jgi:hypothetical protein
VSKCYPGTSTADAYTKSKMRYISRSHDRVRNEHTIAGGESKKFRRPPQKR